MTNRPNENPIGSGGAEIDLWIVPHDSPSRLVALFDRVADVHERSRGERFVREVDRVAYRVSHAALRLVLGSYCRREPVELRFSSGERGKPALDPAAGVHFNLSHTAGLTVIAVSTRLDVGADVEGHAKAGAAKEVFETITAPEERTAWSAARTDDAEFARLWTIKESALKLDGIGMGREPRSIAAIRVDPDDYRVRAAASTGPFPEAYVRTLEPRFGFATAVAASVPIDLPRVVGIEALLEKLET